MEKSKCRLGLPSFDSGLYRRKCVRLPGKQVLEEMADKQTAVPEEANLVPLGDCFCCFIVISELEDVVNL